MRVLHVTPSFYPATYWGGPIFSVHALCNSLAEREGVEIEVLTTDSAGPAVEERLTVDGNPQRYPGGYDVHFARRRWGKDIAPDLLARLPRLIDSADVVHLTAVYSFPTLPTMAACRLKRKPLIWSPRGALQASVEWRDVRRKRAKANYEALCRAVMPRRAVMHVTAPVERELSTQRIPGVAAALIPNGVDVPETIAARSPRGPEQLRLMSIGRIDPKKGLHVLIEALSRLPGFVTADIYGTGEADYLNSLRDLSERLGVGSRVAFHGHVDGDAKRRAFERADLFVLPSFSENFGMVVAEALAHATPVIVSKAAPWKDVEALECGWWIDPRPDALAECVSQALSLAPEGLVEMGAAGREWMVRDFSWRGAAAQMLDVYRWVAGRGGPPECVT
jgi:glycosyltransferase involved in cell wall biosynthesis